MENFQNDTYQNTGYRVDRHDFQIIIRNAPFLTEEKGRDSKMRITKFDQQFLAQIEVQRQFPHLVIVNNIISWGDII